MAPRRRAQQTRVAAPSVSFSQRRAAGARRATVGARRLSAMAILIEVRIECGVVVHFELTIGSMTFPTGEEVRE